MKKIGKCKISLNGSEYVRNVYTDGNKNFVKPGNISGRFPRRSEISFQNSKLTGYLDYVNGNPMYSFKMFETENVDNDVFNIGKLGKNTRSRKVF